MLNTTVRSEYTGYVIMHGIYVYGPIFVFSNIDEDKQ
jgi:hypothetical protein